MPRHSDDTLTKRVYILTADGEENLALDLSGPLIEAGFTVEHAGTVLVGDSVVAHAKNALQAKVPVVLCATQRSVGDEWTYKFVNAANSTGGVPVLVLKMEARALLNHLVLGERLADYTSDPKQALEQLIVALNHHQPIIGGHSAPQAQVDAQLMPFMSVPLLHQDFDQEAIDQYQADLREEASVLRSRVLTTSEFLHRLLVITEGKPTRTASLLFGTNPQLDLPSAIVQCVQYFGVDRTSDRDSVRFAGNARSQIDQSYEFIRQRIGKREISSGASPRAKISYRYPMTCIREVVANAIVHRNYEDSARTIHVRLFEDRLEVASPGAWMGSAIGDQNISLSSLASESVPRNPALAHAMSLIRYFEGEGSGVPTAVQDSRTTGAPEPLVRYADGFVIVTVRPSRYDPEVVERIRKAMQARSDRSYSSPLRSASLNRTYIEPRIVPLQQHGLGRASTEATPGRQLLDDDGRLKVVFGSPGQGKSVLLQRLAGDLARANHSFPILLALRELPQDPLRVADLLAWIEADWVARYGVEAAQGTADAVLHEVPTALLFDGLDEISGEPARHSVLEALEEVSSAYPLAKIVITSREIALRAIDQSAALWVKFGIMPWSREDLELYIRQRAVESDMSPDRTLAFIEELTSSSLRELWAAPVFAGVAFDLFVMGRGSAPRSSFEILEQSVEFMLSRLGTQRTLDIETLEIGAERLLYGELALAAFEQNDAVSKGFTIDWIHDVLSSTRPNDEQIVDRFVTQSRERGSILSNVGVTNDDRSLYLFSMRTVMEFLAAEALVRHSSDEDEFLRAVLAIGRRSNSGAVAEMATVGWAIHHGMSEVLAHILVQGALESPSADNGSGASMLVGLAAVVTRGLVGLQTMEMLRATVRDLDGTKLKSSALRDAAERLGLALESRTESRGQ